jgi:hypothetical protein
MRPISSDYDGTWTDHPEIHGEIDFITTGNNWEKYDHVMDEQPGIPVYFNPGNEELMDIVNHKANVLNKTGAEKHYDDQPQQVGMLKLLCPNCRIILVKGGENTI